MANNKQIKVKIDSKEYEICKADNPKLDCDFCAFVDDGGCCTISGCPLPVGFYFLKN